MKILLLTDFMPPQMHGITIRCVKWVHHLRELGHEVAVLSAKDNAMVDIGCDSAPLPFNPDVQTARYTKGVYAKIKDFNPDIIHMVSPSWPESFIWLYLYALFHEVPVVLSNHVNLPEYNNHYHKNPFLAYFLNRNGLLLYYKFPMIFADAMCGPSVSVGLKLFSGAFSCPKNKLHKFSTGIDRKTFSLSELKTEATTSLRNSLINEIIRISGNLQINKLVLYVGRFAKEKNLDHFIQAAKVRPYIGFVACGSGPEEEDLKSICLKEGISNVLFVGKKTQSELASYYAAADLMLSPSKTESFGFTIIESMAMGTPVIIPDCPIFRELHPGFKHCFVDTDSLNSPGLAYAEKIDELLLPEVYTSLKEQSLKHSQKFNWKDSALDLENIYKSAISNYSNSNTKKTLFFLNFLWMMPVTRFLSFFLNRVFFKYLNSFNK